MYEALIGAGGALAYELLKLFTLQQDEGSAQFQARLRDHWYLLAVAILVLSSGFVAWALLPEFARLGHPRALAAVIGAGARPILSACIQAMVATAAKFSSSKPLSLSPDKFRQTIRKL